MNNENTPRTLQQRIAPFALILSGLAALASIVLFIIYRDFSLPIQISLGLIAIGLALFVLLDPKRALQIITGRQARYGSNALILTIAFIGIIAVANYLINTNDKQWDLTEDQQNSLTSESLETLNSLNAPVEAVAYYTASMPVENARSILQVYQTKSNGQFTYQIVDPVTDPLSAQQDKVTRDGTIVLKMDGRQEQVTFPSEEEITAALVRLANPGDRTVYFLTGHGEYGLEAGSENSYSLVRTSLEAKNYTVETLNLLATPKIPEDALALVVAGATKPLSQAEIDLIRAYQESGGSLVYLAEPRPTTQFGEEVDPMEEFLAEFWGITLADVLVIDPSSNQPLVAVSQRFAEHPITRKMYSMAVLMPTARAVIGAQTDLPQDVQLTEIALTSDMAWGETDYQSIENNQVQPDQGTDAIGPIPLAVAGVNSISQARVMVIGDADFASDSAYGQYGNSDFILNGIDWTAEQEGLISLTPREPIQRFLVVPQQTTMGLILLSSVFLLPGLVLLTGITVWFQRRRRG